VLTPGIGFKITTVSTLMTGTMFLVWLGEQMSERGVGNGISLLIFASIVAGLPAAVAGTMELANRGIFSPIGVFTLFVLMIGVTAFVVFVERGQRRITVNYAKRQQGRRMIAGQSSHLPLKLNMSGVIPPIFASSIILFPASLARFFGDAQGMSWLRDLSTTLGPGQPVYTLIYAGMIVFFCFFYTALVFNPKEIADNLKKSGAFIPGIRPGEQSARYIDGVVSRLTMAGAVYLTVVCPIPELLIVRWNITADHRRCHDGPDGAGPVISDVTSVRESHAQGQSDRRLRRRSDSIALERGVLNHEGKSIGQEAVSQLQDHTSQGRGPGDLFGSAA